MKLIGLLLLLVGFAASVPTPSPDFINVTERFFPEKLKKYTSKHDIVNLMVPTNELNFNDDIDQELGKGAEDVKIDISVVFFVQGDYKKDGTFDNKGLFVLNIKTGEATKLLDNGIDFTAAKKDTKNVFFAATDGIYSYNARKKSAEKYGSVTDNIISIAKANNEDVIYALTANKELYKVTENGEKKVKVDDVKNAQQIVLDDQDNLYFYDDKKNVYVVYKIGYNKFDIHFYDDKKHVYLVPLNGLKKCDGLPQTPNKITLLRPLILSTLRVEEAIPVIIDDKMYMVSVNETMPNAWKIPIELTVTPTAYAPEAFFFQYYAYNKSIYEYNLMSMKTMNVPDAFEKLLDDNKDHIESAETS